MNLLPVMGMGDLSKGFGDVVSHMILPGFCLATIPMATFARTMRSSMIDIMSSDTSDVSEPVESKNSKSS